MLTALNLLAGQNYRAVIDPQRDVDVYITEARTMGVEITHILQTHLHADFISGHMDLAKKTGAKIYVGQYRSFLELQNNRSI